MLSSQKSLQPKNSPTENVKTIIGKELELHSYIIEEINKGTSLEQLIEAVCQRVEALHQDSHCYFQLLEKKVLPFEIKSIPCTQHICSDSPSKGNVCERRQELCAIAHISSANVTVSIKSCWSYPVKNNAGDVLGIFVIYHQKKSPPSEAEIIQLDRYANLFQLMIEIWRIQNELRISAVAFESQEGIVITDANNTIIRINQAFSRITGYSTEEVIGKTPRILRSEIQDKNFYAAMWGSIKKTGKWEGEIWNKRKNGENYPEHIVITAVKDPNGIIINYVATFTDIAKNKADTEEIERLAYYDPLTGLPNRLLLLDRLKVAVASSERNGKNCALLFLDMDNFKILNDTYGHGMGDLLLQQVGTRLEACVRGCDTVARLGGDEFVVMLEDLNEQGYEAANQAEAIGNKILHSLNQPYQLAEREHHSTPSIGVTLFQGCEQSVDDILKQADIAMYQAKTSGRNALRFFDPQMQAGIAARVALETELRLALKNNQFGLYYHPQVHSSGQIIGAEVLARWEHPLRGIISPAEFIPLAEETGLILGIGQWVLETACNQIRAWEKSESIRSLQLSINVSAKQFHQSDFVENIRRVLSKSGINPNLLMLELTESLVIDNIEDAIFKMKALRKMGVRFSMDDFGTGYSSLSSLKKLPIDQLKIDQSFVRDIATNPDDAVIVQTIIAMAKHMGMDVIAEGVESEQQRNFLESHNCIVYQGYLFGKPMPLDELETMLKNSD